MDLEELELLIGSPGDFQQVDASLVQPLNDAEAFLRSEPTIDEVGRVQLDRDRVARTDALADGADDFQQEPGPIGQRPAPAVLPQIGARRQELRQQITVRGVDLHTVEAGFLNKARSSGEAADNVLDVRLGSGARLAETA